MRFKFKRLILVLMLSIFGFYSVVISKHRNDEVENTRQNRNEERFKRLHEIT